MIIDHPAINEHIVSDSDLRIVFRPLTLEIEVIGIVHGKLLAACISSIMQVFWERIYLPTLLHDNYRA